MPPGYVYCPSPDPNPDIYGPIPPEQQIAEFAVYFEPEQPDCIDEGDCPPLEEEIELEIPVRHWLLSSNNPGLLLWETVSGKIGDDFTLDQLKKDFTAQGIYLAPLPPNKAIYTITGPEAVFDIWYYDCDESVPPETPAAPRRSSCRPRTAPRRPKGKTAGIRPPASSRFRHPTNPGNPICR